ncbi:MAG: RhuM family protein [Bacilli bacterium]|nr:RhuM family protein [Bacilli bacterium]MDD4808853.1 RhuM family protein [Bacilli bacterium]
MKDQKDNILIYEDEDGNVVVDAIFKDETLWLTQKGMSQVFDVGVPAISKHLNNIFNEEELNPKVVISKMETTTKHGAIKNKKQITDVNIYNLDAIIAVGYRVNSKKATAFRIWATKVIKEYMIKGFALNDERFIKGNKYDFKYFDELLERIKLIRVSERMSYQKITDLFIATSTDYDSKSEDAYTFFKTVQNKLHFAVLGHTAAELIFSRVDSNKEYMGLTNWKNSPDGLIYKHDATIAKNYLNKEELTKLNELTNLFLIFAEDEARERRIMTMKDWINATDDLLKFRRKEVLSNSGKISHNQAVSKAEKEYEKFRIIQDQEYVSSMDKFYKRYIEESSNGDKNE